MSSICTPLQIVNSSTIFSFTEKQSPKSEIRNKKLEDEVISEGYPSPELSRSEKKNSKNYQIFIFCFQCVAL
jgi:hypothetical protein